ncbi:MAG: hypothetical protein M3033_18475 [Acidobacteriota bacterium]|nr:hypothetical protein [Acidobacteriota bacterium]
MDEIKQKFKSLENAFDNFVKEFGGELISELMPKSVDIPDNADYIFREQNIIAELKCLEKEHLQSEDDYKKAAKQIKQAIEKGLLSESELSKYRSGEKTSDQISKIILSIPRRTIENRIRKAQEQINCSKTHFQKSDAIGLLLLANTGNYFSNHDNLIFQTVNLLAESKRADSPINGFVYFTVDMFSESPLIEGRGTVWNASYKNENQKNLSKFVDELGRKWTEFVSRNSGREIKIIEPSNAKEASEQLKSMSFIRSNK